MRQQIGCAPSCRAGLLAQRVQVVQHRLTSTAVDLGDGAGKFQRRKDRRGG